MFQVLVMGRDNSECLFLVESFQYGFGNGTTYLRFCSSTEFIYQNQTFFIARFHHYLHVGQMRRVSTQIIFNALLVADIDKDVAEYAGMAPFMHRDQ